INLYAMKLRAWCSPFSVPCPVAFRTGLWLVPCAALLLARKDLAADNYTFITSAGRAAYSDGIGNAARFFAPTGIAADSSTNLYVAEFVNHVVRKISLSGTNWVVTTLAGLAGAAGTNDGIGSAARFNE